MWSPSRIAMIILALGATVAVFKFCPCCNKNKLSETAPSETPSNAKSAGAVTVTACSSGPFNSLFSTSSVVYSGSWDDKGILTITSKGTGLKDGSYTKFTSVLTGPFPVPKTTTTTEEGMSFSPDTPWNNEKTGQPNPISLPTGQYQAQVSYYDESTLVECKLMIWKVSA
jgi:hypothetical protein